MNANVKVTDPDLLRMVWLCCGTDAEDVAAGNGVEEDYRLNPAETEFLELARKVQLRLSKD